uniref:Uncharacterized protein n=1 Tax=Onchocerca volvulus TaxID=6282 RepID=A0A8R1XU17_ONCVO
MRCLINYFHRHIISGWPIIIGNEDQAGIPDDIRLSKMSDSNLKRFHSGLSENFTFYALNYSQSSKKVKSKEVKNINLCNAKIPKVK